MNLKDIFNINGAPLPKKDQANVALSVMVPVEDLIKLQKGYIELLENKAKEPQTVKSIEDLTHQLKKVSRDSAMKLADTIRDALATENYTVLAELEKHIRKQSFGECDSDGI